MNICVYEARKDELEEIQRKSEELGVTVRVNDQVPSMDNLELVEGCEGVSMLGMGRISEQLLLAWYERGVGFISTRTVGFDHIDLAAAKRIGIAVCNASYPPDGVAEYTIMMMLLCLRHYKQALWRRQVNDYSLGGLEGKQIGSLTVGVVGTGRIGAAVIRLLHGFGCKILAYDKFQNESIRELVEYTSLEELYARSDMITYHVPLFEETYHMINDESISKMRDGVVIINCARGELADSQALIRGIESGKIGELGLDTIEGEKGITHVDHKTDILHNQSIAYLQQFKNVVITQHMAFYTDVAVKSMVDCGLEGLVSMKETGTYRNML